jgi:hypothetical protein
VIVQHPKNTLKLSIDCFFSEPELSDCIPSPDIQAMDCCKQEERNNGSIMPLNGRLAYADSLTHDADHCWQTKRKRTTACESETQSHPNSATLVCGKGHVDQKETCDNGES